MTKYIVEADADPILMANVPARRACKVILDPRVSLAALV